MLEWVQSVNLIKDSHRLLRVHKQWLQEAMKGLKAGVHQSI